ncbi:9988_t:CDS:1, partial [Acaulospora morrowiae]
AFHESNYEVLSVEIDFCNSFRVPSKIKYQDDQNLKITTVWGRRVNVIIVHFVVYK